MVDFAKLAAPFDPKLVSWRVGQVTKANNRKASALCYIDARDVMQRLDEVCGPDGWEDSYTETAKGRVVCTIRIRVEKGGGLGAMQNGASASDKWVSKSDGAGDTAVEGEKGGISDAFKRAAVKWGIGRYLYDIPVQYVAINEYKQIEKSEYAKLAAALPGSRIACADVEPETPPEQTADDRQKAPAPPMSGPREWARKLRNLIETAATMEAVNELMAKNAATLAKLKGDDRETWDALMGAFENQRAFFAQHPTGKRAA